MDATAGPAVDVVEHGVPAEAGRDFEAFFRLEHERLFRAMWLLTRDRQEAEEVAQEAFLRLWERWARIADAPDPAAYLYRTGLNVWRSRLRRMAVAARKAIHHARRGDEMEDVEARDVVVRSLASLPTRQRAAIVLMDVLDLSSERAGEVLGVRPVTVRVLAARARATLASEMGAGDA
ncbi:MAG TPA: sigma-70 family RNA polymerase sigma factor [Actinomycetota bacterium]|nr:sigma-70 family RNA polymerase sigma factor [Actinomycetota bacterium]